LYQDISLLLNAYFLTLSYPG